MHGAAGIPGGLPTMGAALIRWTISLVIIVGGAVLLLRLAARHLAKLQHRRPTHSPPEVEVLEHLYVNPKLTLHRIRAWKGELLLAQSDNAIKVIARHPAGVHQEVVATTHGSEAPAQEAYPQNIRDETVPSPSTLASAHRDTSQGALSTSLLTPKADTTGNRPQETS